MNGDIRVMKEKCINIYSNIFKQAYDWLHAVKKPFLYLTLIHMAALSAVLRANVNYVDDAGRAYAGYKGWDNFSRYLSNFLSGFLHADRYLSDISPLPQAAAVMLVSLSGIIMIYVITGQASVCAWQLAAVLPLGLSPYFLACLSYKFDAPYMAVSVLASVLPFLFIQGKRGYFAYAAASAACILAVCTTYQAALGIFPMMAVFICIKRWNDADDWKDIGKFLLASILAYAAGLAVFRVFLMKPVDNYVSSSLPALHDLLPSVFHNFYRYFTNVRRDCTKFWKIMMACNAAFFVMVMTCRSRCAKIPAFFMTACAFAAMGLLCFGIYPLLSAPLFAPRAMYGFGAFLAITGVYAASHARHLPARVAAASLGWIFFVFAFTYGNALSAQKEYMEFRMASVISELNTMEAFVSDTEKNIQIAGTIGHAPALDGVMNRYGVLERLVPVNFRSDWDWGSFQFCHYYGLKNIVQDDSVDLRKQKLPVIKDTMYFTLRGEGSDILIKLKR